MGIKVYECGERREGVWGGDRVMMYWREGILGKGV